MTDSFTPADEANLDCAHDWQPDGGAVRFETHPGGELPHVHTTCSKCKTRMWWTAWQWPLVRTPVPADVIARCNECGAPYHDRGNLCGGSVEMSVKWKPEPIRARGFATAGGGAVIACSRCGLVLSEAQEAVWRKAGARQ